MMLSAIDPDLLIYTDEEWQQRQRNCLLRLSTLMTHREMNRTYNQNFVLTANFAAHVSQSFPWNDWRNGPNELRDLMRFILDDLTRAEYISPLQTGQLSISPDDVVCQIVNNLAAVGDWEGLLLGCIDKFIPNGHILSIASWASEQLHSHQYSQVKVENSIGGVGSHTAEIPLLWDEDSWHRILSIMDWWPDIRLCTEIFFMSNDAMRDYDRLRDRPLIIEETDSFLKSIRNHKPNKSVRDRFVEALTKKVYGIHDAGLHDEPFGDGRRFRVTDFWRVHYSLEGDQLILHEFGPHPMGGVD